MRVRTYVLGSILAASLGNLMAADAPYMGKWKLDASKSDFGESTVTYSQSGNGEMQMTADGQSYTFKTDGKDYRDPWGGTAAWKTINASTWEVANKLNGKTLSTNTVTVSADGKTLTIDAKGTRPNGVAFEDTTVYTRVSGGPGLAGKWKTRNVKISSPEVMELAPDGADGMILRIIDINAECKAKFDGKDYPATGPTVPPGLSLAVTKAGPRAFAMVQKIKGKDLYKSAFTVSADGKTLIEQGTPVAVEEKYKAVYERQ